MKYVLPIVAFLAVVLLAFLALGFLLPSEWSAQRSAWIDAPPDSVFPLVNSPAGWNEWTPWPDAGKAVEGPESGVGASQLWDDPDYGSGRFTITASEAPKHMEYEVSVSGGLSFFGEVDLAPDDGGTRITWREEGDFGWNPLLSYMARKMGNEQGGQFEEALARLKELVETGSTNPAGATSAD